MGALGHCPVESSVPPPSSPTFLHPRVFEGGINKICSLNSIVKPPRVNLSNNGLLVTGKELGGTATRIALFVGIYFLFKFVDSTKAYTGFVMDLMIRIALF